MNNSRYVMYAEYVMHKNQEYIILERVSNSSMVYQK